MTHIAKVNDMYSKVHRVDNDNVSYIFGFKSDNEWVFAPYRFILSGHNTKLYGQFISSTWFNHKPMGDMVEYIIVGINKGFKYSDIAQTINSFDTDGDNLNVSHEECAMGISFKDKFTVSMETIREKLDKELNGKIIKTRDNTLGSPKKIFGTTIQIEGKYGKSYLTLSINKLTDGPIYITLPDFMLKYDN